MNSNITVKTNSVTVTKEFIVNDNSILQINGDLVLDDSYTQIESPVVVTGCINISGIYGNFEIIFLKYKIVFNNDDDNDVIFTSNSSCISGKFNESDSSIDDCLYYTLE